MKKFLMIAALVGFAFGAASPAFAGPEDCKEGEKWNEATQQCEKAE
ncbi:MAG: hypothetical protein ACR2PM_10270 [Hyphomicrobiales bacterium]